MSRMLASFVGGNTPVVLIWFGLFIGGLLFIAYALRSDARSHERDESITDLEKVRNLPLRHVREMLRASEHRSTPTGEDGSHSDAKPRSVGGRSRNGMSLIK